MDQNWTGTWTRLLAERRPFQTFAAFCGHLHTSKPPRLVNN